jgi:hypothetical protein
MINIINKFNSMSYEDMHNISKVGGSVLSIWLMWQLMNEKDNLITAQELCPNYLSLSDYINEYLANSNQSNYLDDSVAVTEELPTAVTEELPTAVTEELPTAVTEELPTAVTEELPTAVTEELPTAVTELNTSIGEIMTDISELIMELYPPVSEEDQKMHKIMNDMMNDASYKKMTYMLNNGISWYDYMYPNGE